MHKLLKIGLISALVLFTLGLGFLIAAVALGATWSAFTESVDVGKFSPMAMLHSKTERTKGEMLYYSDVDSLDIEFGKGTLEIMETDEDRIMVEILSDPSGAVTSKMNGQILKISTKNSALRQDTSLRIYLPEDEYFEKASLELGAADVSVELLDADKLEVELGAGIFQGGEILSDKSTWEVGVGELSLDYLDCEDVDIDCGMGCTSVTLADSREDYNFDISCGMGAVSIENDDFSVGDHTIRGEDADGKININCGMGTVDLTFDSDSDEDDYLNQVSE